MPTSRVGKRSSARARRGITLIEMIVVVAILALIVGVAFPSMIAGLDAVHMIAATDSVASFLNAAVNRAQRRQEAVELIIDFRQNQMSAFSNDPAFTRELKLPDGITFETDQQEPRRVLLLLPGASVPGVNIPLVSNRGTRRIVHLDPMTGYPRVESVKKS